MSHIDDNVMFTATADKTITNTVTETTAFASGVGTLTFAPDSLDVGRTIRIVGLGTYTTPAITGGTVTLKVKLGSTIVATVNTSALLVGASGSAFHFEVCITVRSTGVSGSVICAGAVDYEVASAGRLFDNLNNGGATTTIDTTIQQILDVTVTWDGASSTRIVKTTIATVEVLD